MMRELKVEDALLYLDQVKVEFGDRPHIYNEFLDIMKTFKTQQIDTPGVIRRVSTLFQGNRKLVLGFNTFLPEGYKIELPMDGDGPPVAVFRQPGSTVTHILHPTGPIPAPATTVTTAVSSPAAGAAGEALLQHQQQHQQRGVMEPRDHMQQQQQQQLLQNQLHMLPQQQQAGMFAAPDAVNGAVAAPQPATTPQQAPQGPMEFDHAINYVTDIKRRFVNDPDTYKKFLEILHTYQKEQRGIKEVLDEVSTLFEDHPDLLKEFTFFLPDAVQAQAKAQLDAAAKEAEERKRAKAKQAIMDQAMQQRQPPPNKVVVHFGATQGRSADQEHQIAKSARFGVVSFEPRLPKKRGELSASQAAVKNGRPTSIPPLPLSPNTSEALFFARAKMHLNRRELAAERPSGSRRHTPYTEFLKCLHLFGAGILNRQELVLLLRGLFMQGHAPKTGANAGGGNANPVVAEDAAELLREFEEVLIGRGPFCDQEVALKSRSKYGTLRVQDFEFTEDRATPSYRYPPADYPQSLFLAHPGQEEDDMKVLNTEVFCVASDDSKSCLEDYNGVMDRKNANEDEMFRIEDERYEVDMAIERSAQALSKIEPFAEEVQKLREQEEKDGQPIGRLQYQLNKGALNSTHIHAIGRLYGDSGDEVLQHLQRNPLMVLPIVYKRLEQKNTEWRNCKAQLMDGWAQGALANYEGSRDVLSHGHKREVEKMFGSSWLLDECRRARIHARRGRDVPPSVEGLMPQFGTVAEDALLFESFVAVSHLVNQDACRVVLGTVPAESKARIGRLVAEFWVPWLGVPAHWVTPIVRESYGGRGSMVQFAQGQRVVTAYGEGTITGVEEDHYTVKLPFGIGQLAPSAILHAHKATPHVRREGVMMADEQPEEGLLNERYRLLFGTESVYLFMRRFMLLCRLLSDMQDDALMIPEDPTKSYTVPGPSTPESTAEEPGYRSVVTCLTRVLRGESPMVEYESMCRKISSDKVHVMAAIPKLVERCVDCLIQAAREDVCLQLYDYCQHAPLDPIAVRARCFEAAPDALYRMQYDTVDQKLYFSYLPRNAELHLEPHEEEIDVSMEEEEQEQTSDTDSSRTSKRQRLD